jgi:hypothetical protein
MDRIKKNLLGLQRLSKQTDQRVVFSFFPFRLILHGSLFWPPGAPQQGMPVKMRHPYPIQFNLKMRL